MSARAEPTIEQQIEQLAADVLPSSSGRLGPDAVLAELGFDSLACADLALAVEDRFGVRLADADVQEVRTLSDVAEAVAIRTHEPFALPRAFGRSVGTATAVVRPPLRWWFHLEITGTEHIPATGPVIIAPNHRSMWDIPMVVVACPRRVVFMAKQELYKNAVLRRMWLELGAFPVRREIADLRAIDNALEVLRAGWALGIYPEGTRSFTGEMLPFLKGAAWLALLTGAPIVPCGIRGTSRRTRRDEPRPRARRPVRVVFGPPIGVSHEPDPLSRRFKAEDLTDEVLARITALIS
jgi:1-acyl-sn-glycerol-3-phosphate acyltransferase